MNPDTVEPAGFIQPKHNIHVLDADKSPAFSYAVERPVYDNPVSLLVHIQADMAEISCRNGRYPGIRQVIERFRFSFFGYRRFLQKTRVTRKILLI
jgi:hypothetical protein